MKTKVEDLGLFIPPTEKGSVWIVMKFYDFLAQNRIAIDTAWETAPDVELQGPSKYITCRSPQHRSDASVEVFHTDRDDWPGNMIVWAHSQPTEIRAASGGKIFKGEPCHVYRFSNKHFMHRTPKGAQRWFLRVFEAC